MFGGERLTKSLSDACVRHVRHLVVWERDYTLPRPHKMQSTLPLPRGCNTR
jgi:hypothetical protein